MINKKIIVFSIIFINFIAICGIIFIFCGGAIKLSEIENIEITATNESLKSSISDFNDIKDIGKILNKHATNDSPSCPFGYVKITIKQKNSDVVIYPATDSCHIFKIRDKYFHTSNGEWEKLMKIFNNYGIDRSLFESGNGI